MVEIIEATIAHIDSLVELFDQYRIFYEKTSDKIKAKHFLSDRINKDESKIFLCKENEVVVGFVQLYPIFSSTKMQRLWLLNDLFVHPDYRGRGYSKNLIDRCKEYAIATNASGLLLETAKSNTIGNSLYPSIGFVLDKDHHYYSWENTGI